MTIDRRRFLGAAAGFATVAGLSRRARAATAPIEDAPPALGDAELLEIFTDNREPTDTGLVVKGLNDWPLWWEDPAPFEQAVWPEDENAIDYAHFEPEFSDAEFMLTDAALRRILAANSFAPIASNPRVLFGLRGCMLAEEEAAIPAFKSALRVREARPDHFSYRCLMGVWDRNLKMVWATPASTVPHVAYLYAQREAGTFANEANMMPTGLYRYKVGTHRNGSRGRQPGAFRPDNKGFAVIRSVDDGPIRLSRDKYWDTRTTNHGDNIHAGTYTAPRDDRPLFWSAGCQVIPGYYQPQGETPQGGWARFRIAAGLDRDPTLTRNTEVSPGRFDVATKEDGRRFSYLLTTGRDARLAGGPDAALPPTLRFGSRGDLVKTLQAALGVPAASRDGVFGVGTQRLLLGGGHSNTAIVDPAMIADLAQRSGEAG